MYKTLFLAIVLTAVIGLQVLVASAVSTNETTTCITVDKEPKSTPILYHVNNTVTTNGTTVIGNTPCLLAKFAAHLKIGDNYLDLTNGTVNDKVSTCQKLTVDFACGQLHFEVDKNDTQIIEKGVAGFYKINGTETIISNSTNLFIVPITSYFRCDSEQVIVVGNSTKLVLTNFAFEGYRNSTDFGFSKKSQSCLQDAQTYSDWVRVAVGICLVALVAIVLVAYFVGRRRWSERSSYESV